MKAILLAGGFGTRLRPLTLSTPKPIVPLFDRPFLYHQIDLLRRVPAVDEVILSLNYRPDRIEATVRGGGDAGLPVRYLVEPEPRGTGGAVKFAESHLDGTTFVFNGDVLTDIDLNAMLQRHRALDAHATIFLKPVEDPTRYGLVETDPEGRITRFVEKPDPSEVTCRTINAGVYLLEPDTFDLIPANEKHSIERGYFPALIERGETVAAYIEECYWRDIGTPEAYLAAHRDILDGLCHSACLCDRPASTGEPTVADGATVDPGANLNGPCYVGPGATIRAGAEVGPYAVIGEDVLVKPEAELRDSIVWPGSTIGIGAVLRGAIAGRDCIIGNHATLGPGTVLGDSTTVTSYTHA
ncbi:MAG: NDP-sugar synthase [Acidobacteria bacterium]|nr:NDP-sugar synthase [Acidobacteriota bacterium]MXZ71605.1 NDP-sugar synthase [Acidobacteriota bacterium]MYD69733.1 NDP-sugar synthase [Acidobacteriota bacterium]MYJ03608.1 NDP-sugar synthase [Acidobacteriota bacterium]